ncbi:DUF4387 domain-containing protein [Paraburkholderia bannensis]|uniref:DUF4387 domain-containing protein n=1 Tax=Paraburkholderia bannensis TaxID=765414 RepID=UPI002AB049CE|nr:DUF4387 domain-containing protein [Paraburkholderia bannensis]
MKLAELTSLIRSKNAGPFTLTFDVMFSSEENYARVKKSGALSASVFAALFQCEESAVRFFVCDKMLAFKFSIPRPIFSGDLGDGDLHGGQQFVPLMNIEIA